jgi:hypothetical protein
LHAHELKALRQQLPCSGLAAPQNDPVLHHDQRPCGGQLLHVSAHLQQGCFEPARAPFSLHGADCRLYALPGGLAEFGGADDPPLSRVRRLMHGLQHGVLQYGYYKSGFLPPGVHSACSQATG